MKIAISAAQPHLESEVDTRFGRCSHFIMIDPETMEWQAIENRDAAFSSGAGIGAAQLVVTQGAGAVITGIVGPNASRVLTAAGVQVFTVPAGTVRQAVEAFKAGQLQSAQQAPSPSSFGMGRGMGRGPCGGGQGMGRSVGRGMGRRQCGRGGGMGRGMGGAGIVGGGGRRGNW